MVLQHQSGITCDSSQISVLKLQHSSMEEESTNLQNGVTINESSDNDSSGTAKTRSKATSMHSELIVEVDNVLFYLHKFPVLSRSGRLNELQLKARDEEETATELQLQLQGFPGGPDAFETAVKFCYDSLTIEINPSNVAPLRCAAEYLQMTEEIASGNLVAKTEQILSSMLSLSWLDCFTILRSCSALKSWADDLNIVHRCIHSISDKVAAAAAARQFQSQSHSHSHSHVAWPYTACSVPNKYLFLYPPSVLQESNNNNNKNDAEPKHEEESNNKKNGAETKHVVEDQDQVLAQDKWGRSSCGDDHDDDGKEFSGSSSSAAAAAAASMCVKQKQRQRWSSCSWRFPCRRSSDDVHVQREQ